MFANNRRSHGLTASHVIETGTDARAPSLRGPMQRKKMIIPSLIRICGGRQGSIVIIFEIKLISNVVRSCGSHGADLRDVLRDLREIKSEQRRGAGEP